MKIREAAKSGFIGALQIAGAAALAMSEASAYDYYDVVFKVKEKNFLYESNILRIVKTDADAHYYTQVVRAIENAEKNPFLGNYSGRDVYETIKAFNKYNR